MAFQHATMQVHEASGIHCAGEIAEKKGEKEPASAMHAWEGTLAYPTPCDEVIPVPTRSNRTVG